MTPQQPAEGNPETASDTLAPTASGDRPSGRHAAPAIEGVASSPAAAPRADDPDDRTDPRFDRPWPAMWSIVLGFFMILVDTTIVVVAMPRMQDALKADLGSVIWVTSAYLLAYAVPLLISGRLGDRFGPKRLYLIGLVGFTLTSLLCGLAPSIEWLIFARVLQGLSASLMTPQTMSIITRMFPPQERGKAMAVWGATAGIATLVGPLLGGFLVDVANWNWIFFVNVPVGVLAFWLASRNVPHFNGRPHRFDWLGVLLSGVGLFCIVFGIEEGNSHDWGTLANGLDIFGAHLDVTITIWQLIITGIVFMVLFVIWQAVQKGEPLVPLGLFRDQNFSVSNIAIALMGGGVVMVSFPQTIYYQQVHGFTPTQAALMMVPMAVMSLVLAPVVGGLTARVNPKWLVLPGFVSLALAQLWLHELMTPDANVLWQLLPMALMGIGNSLIWGPLSMSATRNLPLTQAGAGSGVYNTTRQIGSVLGSAAIATLMGAQIEQRIRDTMQQLAASGQVNPAQAGAMDQAQMQQAGQVPELLREPLATAMATSLWLPIVFFAAGAVVSLFMAKPVERTAWGRGPAAGSGEDASTAARDAAESTPAAASPESATGETEPPRPAAETASPASDASSSTSTHVSTHTGRHAAL